MLKLTVFSVTVQLFTVSDYRCDIRWLNVINRNLKPTEGPVFLTSAVQQ